MRGQIIVAVAASALTVAAFAQTTSNTATTAAPGQPAASTTTAAPAATTATAAPAPTAGTSTASLDTTAKQVKERKFKVDFYNYNEIMAADLNNSQGVPTSDNYIGLKYLIGGGQSVSLRQPFLYDFPKAGLEGEGTEGKGTFNDMYLAYTHGKLAQFADKGNVVFSGRVYLPTGEASRSTKKTNGALRAHGIVSYPVGPVDLDTQLLVQWYNQSQNWWDNDGTPTANLDYIAYYYPVTGSWNANDKLSFWAGTYFTMGRYRPTPDGKIKAIDSFTIDASASLSVLDNLNMSVGAYNELNIGKPKHDHALLRDSEVAYYLSLSASL